MIQVFAETRRKLLMNAASYDHRMEFDDAADELYGLSPGEFVSRRNELVKDARAAGDRGLADTVGGLRRPTLSAWAINQWVRADPDGVDALIALGAELAAAQRRAAVAQVRELSARRRQVVADGTRAVTDVAAERGQPIAAGAVREITTSLRAAIADEEIATQLRSGRLVTAVEYSGFGPAGVFLVPDPVSDGGRVDLADEHDADKRDAEQSADEQPDDVAVQARAAAQAELDEAIAGEAAIHDELERARTELHAVRSRVEELARRTEELRAELERVDGELRFARRRETTADKACSDIESRHRAAARRVDAARRAVET